MYFIKERECLAKLMQPMKLKIYSANPCLQSRLAIIKETTNCQKNLNYNLKLKKKIIIKVLIYNRTDIFFTNYYTTTTTTTANSFHSIEQCTKWCYLINK